MSGRGGLRSRSGNGRIALLRAQGETRHGVSGWETDAAAHTSALDAKAAELFMVLRTMLAGPALTCSRSVGADLIPERVVPCQCRF